MGSILSGYDLLARQSRRVLASAFRGTERVAKLDNFVYRQVGVSSTLAAMASADVLLGVRAPSYITSIGANGSESEGFEFQLFSDEGRFFSSPLISSLFEPGTAHGAKLQYRRETWPRIVTGAVRVRVRSLAPAAQTCNLLFGVAEPLNHLIPLEVAQEAAMVSGLYLSQVDTGIAASAASASSGGAASGGTGGAVGDGMQDRVVSISLLNSQEVVLEGSESTSTEIWSFSIYLDGSYPDAVTVTPVAINASGRVRALGGSYPNLTAGASISFAPGAFRYWTLEPGENLAVVAVNSGAVAAAFGGFIQFKRT